MRKTLIVWRRTGKEHGEDAFRVDPPAVIGGPYIPGVRLYLDNHKLIRSGMAVRDGLHLIKVKRKLPLADFLLAAISVDVLDPHRSKEEWTPMTFFRKANAYFHRTFPEQNS